MEAEQKMKSQHFSGTERIIGQTTHDNIHISGSSTIDGNLECNDLNISGHSHGLGNLVVHGKFHNSGLFTNDGHLIVERNFHSSGSSTIKGNLTLQGDLKSTGMFNSHGNTYFQQNIDSSGVSRYYGHVVGENSFKNTGVLTVKGHLIVPQIQCVQDSAFGFLKSLLRSTIEGSIVAQNYAELRHVNVNGDIIGKTVKIGSNCMVKGNIFYVENLELKDDSEILGKKVQITPQQLEDYIHKFKEVTAVAFSSSQSNTTNSQVKEPASQEMKFCPSCGYELKQAKKFCPLCGTNLGESL
jgi:cytoskeletal protein CcmA (bactofilin family)